MAVLERTIGRRAARVAVIGAVTIPALAARGQDWAQYGAGPRRLSTAGSVVPPAVGVQRWALTQHNGQASTTLTLDLVFDTADEVDQSGPGQAKSVKVKTQEVEKFVLPAGSRAISAPPAAT